MWRSESPLEERKGVNTLSDIPHPLSNPYWKAETTPEAFSSMLAFLILPEGTLFTACAFLYLFHVLWESLDVFTHTLPHLKGLLKLFRRPLGFQMEHENSWKGRKYCEEIFFYSKQFLFFRFSFRFV